ncbi:MAG TPA: amidohydrolase family protein [Thermoplasmata archaeon]|nr:amidohydrolase family protein [Thermoplasmata archaeon]
MSRRPPRVDTHLHLSRWWRDLRRTGYRADLDYTVRGLLHEMDQNRIGHGLILQLHEAPTVADGLNEGRATSRQSRGRLRPVTTVDPTKGKEAIRRAIELWETEKGLAGIKLYPGYQPFYPHDPRLAPVYEYAHRRGLPVLIHQGDTLDGIGLVKFARPVEVDEVAGRYRDVTIVLCHFGNPWIAEGAEVVFKNPNVYADTSGLLAHPTFPYFERMIEQSRRVLYEAIVTIGRPDRILYGSDWPLEELGVAVDLIDRLDLPETDRDLILGGNARRLFHLPEISRPAAGFS